ncbi:hypothetical protein MTR_2g018230 [Medicago truncatula]|uniref:Uncharacterized protein n=1 Tax=Medicago truncatula TaxID=3880 RepID=G7ILV5_MEDTR|nr:hypothetical protein MTR_2g018230 [Medicago truncatula]
MTLKRVVFAFASAYHASYASYIGHKGFQLLTTSWFLCHSLKSGSCSEGLRT